MNKQQECCKKAENLIKIRLSSGIEYLKCIKCNRRHFEIGVEPGSYGLKMNVTRENP